jgi:hypothetical protein
VDTGSRGDAISIVVVEGKHESVLPVVCRGQSGGGNHGANFIPLHRRFLYG